METTAVVMQEETRKRRERGTGRIYQHGRYLWLKFYDGDGRARCENSHTTDWKAAEKLLRKRIGARDNDVLPPPSRMRVTVNELYSRELDYLRVNQKQTRWIEACWRLRLEPHFGGRRASSIRRADLEDYQTVQMRRFREEHPDADVLQISRAEGMVNRDLAVLRMCLRRGHAIELLDAVPTFPERLQGTLGRTGVVTEEQFEKMLADCKPEEPWLKAFLVMAFAWGYRLQELLRMRVAQVNLNARSIWLPPRSTKNKHPRLIPIGDRELPLLCDLMEGKSLENLIFTRTNGKPVRDFRDRWDKLVTASQAGHFVIDEKGQKSWHPAIVHDLRRTAITNMLTRGVPAEHVRAICGHLDPEMTAKYNRPSPDVLRLLAGPQLVQLPAQANGYRTGTNEVVQAAHL